MKVSIEHASLQWLLHVGCAVVAVMAAPVRLASWLTLALCLVLQLFAARALRKAVVRGSVLDARVVAALGHAPGLVASTWVLASFTRIVADRFGPIVFLQLWTAPFTPLIELVPRGGVRSHYVWLVAALPFIEASAMARFADAARPTASPASGKTTASRP